MQKDLQNQAIFTLLTICDKDSIDMSNYQDDYKHSMVLCQQKNIKSYTNSNTINMRNTKYHRICKIKTQKQSESFQNKTNNSTQNKQNLKKMLQKLTDSPIKENQKKSLSKKVQFELKHIKVLKSQPNSLSKHRQMMDISRYKKSIKQFNISRENEVIKTLIKAKIIEKLQKSQTKIQNTYGNSKKKHNYTYNISTLRQIQRKHKKSQNLISKQNKLNMIMIKEQQNINQGMLFTRRNSRINLKTLIF